MTNTALIDFLRYTAARVETSQTRCGEQTQLRQAHLRQNELLAALRYALTPDQQQLLSSLLDTEQEVDYWHLQAAYMQGLLDAQALPIFLTKNNV